MKTIVFVANRSFALSNSRKELINALISSGNKVVVCASRDSHSDISEIPGVVFFQVPFYRGGASIFGDMYSFLLLFFVILKYSPDMVHSFNAKPVIFSGILLRVLFSKSESISVITGLGHAFIHGRLLKRLAGIGYRFALRRKNNHTVFQNADDYNLFLQERWIVQDRSSLIVGSGVDVERFSSKYSVEKSEKKVLMIGRLLKQKGVGEFIEAAVLLKKRDLVQAKFVLIGERDEVHPDAIDFCEVQKSVDDGCVEYLGFKKDVVSYIQDADIFVLPSYREGVPRTVLEAASCGVPCIGANVPGTRECIVNGKTGYLVEVQNVSELAEKILFLLKNDSIRMEMSIASRSFMKERFDIESITRKYLKLYSNIGGFNV